MSKITPFVADVAYHACMTLLWSEIVVDDNDQCKGGFDKYYGIEDIPRDERDALAAKLMQFCADGWAPLSRLDLTAARVGHNFILSANGHGSGFWDRGWGADGDQLHDLAKTYGDIGLEIGDDELPHITGL